MAFEILVVGPLHHRFVQRVPHSTRRDDQLEIDVEEGNEGRQQNEHVGVARTCRGPRDIGLQKGLGPIPGTAIGNLVDLPLQRPLRALSICRGRSSGQLGSECTPLRSRGLVALGKGRPRSRQTRASTVLSSGVEHP